jgi:hypothetical protein
MNEKTSAVISGNGQPNVRGSSYALLATERQIHTIEVMAARQRMSFRLFCKSASARKALTRAEASRLIDELQAADCSWSLFRQSRRSCQN